MKIAVIDGQGGGIGKAIVENIRKYIKNWCLCNSSRNQFFSYIQYD